MPVGDDTFGYRRDLPHLQKAGKTFFLTFCTRQRRVLSPIARDIALDCCVHDHQVTYWLHAVCVMPDHVHMLFLPFDYTLATIASRIKSVSARLINAQLGTKGPIWQREYFDRILRSADDVHKKAEYICANPVRAGLVTTVDEYPWIWRSWIDGETPPRSAAPH